MNICFQNAIIDDIDGACTEFAKHLGYEKELQELFRNEHERLENLMKQESIWKFYFKKSFTNYI